MKPATWLASIILAFVAIGHLGRVLFSVRITIGEFALPQWPSVIAFVVCGALAIGLWRESRRRV